ncbi:polysaccharide deacetylase [Novosphingobium sp. PC22D]|nr:polysaccharide deacetylase [Novosphingobium sp. PC22D]
MPRLSCCLTFDVDGMSAWIGTLKTRNPSMISRGEFTITGTRRVLQLLRRHDLQASFFVPGHTICAYPDLIREIADAGHEIGHHGWVHENPADFEREGERIVLERGLAAMERIGVRPVGYRSPAWDFSPNTVPLLNEYCFLYDSSCMGDDFNPYYLRAGDEFSSDEPYRFGALTPLVELPVSWGLDDYPAFETIPGINRGYSPPSAVEEIWEGDFAYAHEHCPQGIFTLTMHPEFIGRGHRIAMLERLIERFSRRDGVRFSSLAAYADKWRTANPLAEWREANPLRAGSGAIETLPRQEGASRRQTA